MAKTTRPTTASRSGPHGARILRLVPQALAPAATSEDVEKTIVCLLELLQQARAGRIKGLAYGAMLSGGGCVVDAAGAAYWNPTFTRGMLRGLDDALAKL